MNLNLKPKLNQLKYSLYKDCSDLPIQVFLTILNKSDLRYLVKSKTIIDYDNKKLVSKWNEILAEYEQLTNSHEYTEQLRKTQSNGIKLNRLNGLIACYHLARYKQTSVIEDCKWLGLDITELNEAALNLIELKIKQERTRLHINTVREKASKIDKKPVEYEKVWASYYDRGLDIENKSVKKFIFLSQEIGRKSNELKKHARNIKSR